MRDMVTTLSDRLPISIVEDINHHLTKHLLFKIHFVYDKLELKK